MNNAKNQELQELLTLKETATLLKCHQNTLRTWDRNGVFKAVRLGQRKLLRYRRSDIQQLLNGKSEMKTDFLKEDRFTRIKKFLVEHADTIQKLATKEHKKYLGGKKFRSEVIQHYQDLHIRTVKEFAKNLDDLEKGVALFKKLGTEIAEEAVKDNLTIKEAVDGFIFLKQGVWKSLEKEKLLVLINSKDFHMLSLTLGTFCDVIATQIAFTFHDNALKKSHESEENLSLIIDNVKDYGIMRLDLKGNVVFWNSGAERLLGYTEQEILSLIHI